MKRILPLFIALAFLFTACSSANNNAAKGANASVQSQNSIYIMVGKVEAGEKADITSKIPAKVSEISVDVGSSVKQGDPIIKLDTKDLEAQVGQANAALATAKANLANAQSGSRPEQIAQAQANVESTRKNYENAKSAFDRTNQLYSEGGMSKQQLETAEGQLKTNEAAFNSAKDSLDMLSKGNTQETLAVYESQVKQAQAALELANTGLSNGSILSPISGTISAKNINVGELAAAGIPLVSVVNSGSLYVNAYLPASLNGKVKAGQDVVVKISEIPDKEFQGVISIIDPVIDAKSKNILVKVKFKEPDSNIIPGMFAEVGIKK
jgi:HlyD family secretion protein